MDTSALALATLAPPALFGIAMLVDQLAERRHRRHLEARRAAAVDQLAERRRHPSRRARP